MLKRNFILIALPFVINLYADSLSQLIVASENNPSLNAVKKEAKASKEVAKAVKSALYPHLDFSYNATYLQEKPVVYLNSSFALLPPNSPPMQIEAQNSYKGALTLSYPLFSGFAISKSIDKAMLEKERALLKVKDTKRNLYLHIVSLYTTAYALKEMHNSLEVSLRAMQQSYEKVKAFYTLGMSSSSELYRIQAALHDVEAKVTQTDNQYKIVLNQLSVLCKTEVHNVAELPEIGQFSYEELVKSALINRPDLKAIELLVKKEQKSIEIAKSKYYPTVGLYAQAAYSGDTPSLDGDGYTNKNKSSAGFVVKYNLFSGFKDDAQIEAAKDAKLSLEFMLASYKDRVKSELYSSYLEYKSLQKETKSIQLEQKAQKTYTQLIKEKFENQLADADTLSRAIAQEARVESKLSATHARLYNVYARLLLEVNSETFLEKLQKDR